MITVLPTSELYVDSFHRCLDAVARERRFLAFLEAPPVGALREFIRAIVSRGAIQFLALDGDAVVGWCDVLARDLEGFTHVGALGMGVASSHRRRGIGERLVTAALERSRAAGLERVELEVFRSNGPAIALYEKLGFTHEGTKRGARKLDGVYDDTEMMAVSLQ